MHNNCICMYALYKPNEVGEGTRLMMGRISQTIKIGLALLVAFFSSGLLPAASAYAYSINPKDSDSPKVWVCKYVGKPGVDERLKSGQNPISVDNHNYTLGSYFNDGQGRSYVVAWDPRHDSTAPPVSMCPAPDDGPDVITAPAAPPVNDPCGTGNATWVLPANTVSIHWSLDGRNHLIATAQPGYIFTGNRAFIDFDVAPETNTAPCIVKIQKPPVQLSDPCGVHNAVWIVPTSDRYTVTQLPNRSVTITAQPGYTFDDGTSAGTKSYTIPAPQDSGTLCWSEPIPQPTPIDPCGINNAYWTKPRDTSTVKWSIVNGRLIATATGVLFTDGRSTIDFGLAADSGTRCNISLPHTPSTNDPCGLDNATWNMPKNTHEYTWSLTSDGHLIATTTANYIFKNGETTHDFGVAPDSGQPCPVTIIQPTCEAGGSMTLDLAQPNFGKYYYDVTIGLTTTRYTESQLPVTINGIAQGATVQVKLVRDGTIDTLIFKKEYKFNMLNCIAVPETPVPADPCGPDNAAWVKPDDTATIRWTVTDDGRLVATAVGSRFTNGETTIDYGVAQDSRVLCAPEPPQRTIKCGLYNNDQVTLPATDETSRYSWHQYWKGHTLVVKAVADEGYSFDDSAQTKWYFVDTHTQCDMPDLMIAPKTCTADATVTIAYDTERYYYTIQLDDGEESALGSGTTTLSQRGTYTVRGYEYYPGKGTRANRGSQGDRLTFSETFTITDPACEPGKGAFMPLPNPTELPRTGNDGILGWIVALISAATVYGAVYFAQPRR